MANYFPTKTLDSLMEEFKQASVTESSMDHSMDMKFSGTNTVHIMDILTVPLTPYNRSVDPSTGSRYGKVHEVQDVVHTYTMTQDVGFSASIDKGNNKEQLNMKTTRVFMTKEKDEQIVPFLDKYRLEQWAKKAGIHHELSGDLTKSNIAEAIIDLHDEMIEAGAPESGCTLYIPSTARKLLKLSPEWVSLDSLGGKTLPSGSIAEFDGMAVKRVASRFMPKGCEFLIIHKSSVFSPMKINEIKASISPPGLSGDLVEYRMLMDAFVLGSKAQGVAAACKKGTVVAAPTFSGTSSITIATETTGATIYYTLDGSDPRYSANKKTYTAAVTLAPRDVLKAYADKDGMFSSAVSTK